MITNFFAAFVVVVSAYFAVAMCAMGRIVGSHKARVCAALVPFHTRPRRDCVVDMPAVGYDHSVHTRPTVKALPAVSTLVAAGSRIASIAAEEISVPSVEVVEVPSVEVVVEAPSVEMVEAPSVEMVPRSELVGAVALIRRMHGGIKILEEERDLAVNLISQVRRESSMWEEDYIAHCDKIKSIEISLQRWGLEVDHSDNTVREVEDKGICDIEAIKRLAHSVVPSVEAKPRTWDQACIATLEGALAQANGNRSKAARLLEMPRSTFNNRCNKYGV